MILVECKPDETLLRVLGVPRKEIRHCRGKSVVCNEVRRAGNTLGLVDEDPGRPPERVLRAHRPEEKAEQGLTVFQVGTGGEIIVLCPRLEEWVLDAAREVGLEPKQFGLPDSGGELHRIVNQHLDKWERFIRAIQERRSPRFQLLKSLIEARR